MKVVEFIQKYKESKVQNTKMAPDAVEQFLKKTLEVKEYVPFKKKEEIVKTIIEYNLEENNGIKKIDSINQYLSFISAMLVSHTNLEISEVPADDYDLLAEHDLIEQIVALFAKDYKEFETLLKMAVADELEDNNLSVVVSKFFNGILDKVDDVVALVANVAEGFDTSKLFGEEIKKEDLGKLIGLLDKLK